MPSKIKIKLLIACVFLMVVVVLSTEGRAISIKDLFSTLSYVVTGTWFILFIWDRWLWSFLILNLLSKRPDLRGTWKGTLRSDYPDPTTQEKKGLIDVYLVIRQTNSTIDVRLFSAESSSVSLSGNLIADNGGVNMLTITYRNEPRLFNREHSQMSYGGMLLHVRGDKVYQLDGEYWTDRATRGEIKFSLWSKAKCHDFGQASQVAYQVPKASA
jgi:hypothetical protein